MAKGSKVLKNVPPPDPPKKPLTAFFLFRKEVYDEVKEENPTSKITKLTQIIGEKWRALEEEERKAYETEYVKLRDKYHRDLENYEMTYGKMDSKIKRSKKAKLRE